MVNGKTNMTKEQVKQKLAKIREEFERTGFLTKK